MARLLRSIFFRSEHLDPDLAVAEDDTRLARADGTGSVEATAQLLNLRLQGLLAAREFMAAANPAFDQRLEAATRDAVNFLLRACVGAESRVRPMPKRVRAGKGRAARAAHPTDTRLDDVEQALAALVDFARSP